MTIATAILKAPYVGVRELKTHLSKFLKTKIPFIVTERGVPVDVVLPYSDIVEIVELIDEATDSEALRAVQQGRQAIQKGAKGIPIGRILKKIRKD